MVRERSRRIRTRYLPQTGVLQFFCSMSMPLKFPGSFTQGFVLVSIPLPHVFEHCDQDPQLLKFLFKKRFHIFKTHPDPDLLHCLVSLLNPLKLDASCWHVLVLVWIPLPHVFEQSDHDPQSLKYISNLLQKLIKNLPKSIFNRHFCFDYSSFSMFHSKAKNQDRIMWKWAVVTKLWIDVIDHRVHVLLKIYD